MYLLKDLNGDFVRNYENLIKTRECEKLSDTTGAGTLSPA
jgi:hypothetical protein